MGHDWAEDHHDIAVVDSEGRQVGKARLPEGAEGVARFHALIADHVDGPAGVVVATETDRGLFVGALVAAGYQVYAVNPPVDLPLSGTARNLGGEVRPW